MGIFLKSTDFGRKLKALKLAYKLNNVELSRYCTIVNESNVSTSAISYWEQGKRVPSIEAALLIADIFAVTTDWLIAHENYTSKSMYNEERLEFLETTFIERGRICVIRDEDFAFPYFDVLSTDYLDLEQRKLNYSHEARANVIFLMYVIDFEWQRYIKANITKFKEINDITFRNLAMRIWDFFMTVPGDPTVIREAVDKVKIIMENKEPLYKVRW